jgi:O-antigen ligase
MLYCVRIVFEPVEFLVRSRVEYFQFVVGGCILPSVVFLFNQKEELIQRSLKWLAVGTIMIGMLSFYLYRFNASGRMSKGEFLGDFVALGSLQVSYLGSLSLVLAFGVYQGWRGQVYSKLIVFLLLALLGLYQLFLGASRGASVAVVIAVGICVIASIRSLTGAIRLFAGVCVLLLVLACALALKPELGATLFTRFADMLHFRESYYFGGFGIGRIFLYQETFAQTVANPIFGSGLTIRGIGAYPHNFILEAYMSTGILGGSAFLVFLFAVVKRSLLLARFAPSYMWVSAVFLHYLVNAMLSSSMVANSYFWFSAFTVLGCYYAVQSSNPEVHRKF